MVTTPQEVALSDVRRSLNMLQKVHIPVLGILENMSYHKCACCGRRSEVFGAGGGALLAAAEGVPLLACLPLDEQAMHGGEEGAPVVLTHPYSAIGAAFRDAAAGVCKQLELETGR
jgi:ATP-binding protein involved in chromosome partitioning